MVSKNSLALYGGKPVREKPLPVMHPGATFFDEAEVKAVLEVLKAQSPYRFYGPNFLNITGKFEAEFRKYIGTTFSLAVTSGTAALHTALRGLEVGEDDEVIIPTYSWVACPSAVVATGAKPVLANVDDSLTLDPDDVERRITNRTKVIMAVHIRGVPCDLDRIVDIAKRYQIFLLEDVAQCCGGSYHGKRLGSIGDAGSFSFQLNKMISAGEGGAIVTNDQTTYERCLMFHDTGTPYRGLEEKELRYSIQPFPGVNYRANEISSAILRVQLSKMDTIIRRIREIKSKIKKGISDIPGLSFRRIPDPEGEVAVGLVFFTESKDKAILFKEALMAENIRTPSGSYPGVVYEPLRNDGHVFMHWGHLLPGIERVSNQYRQTLDLLSRAVHIDISPLDGEQEINDIIEGIRKVSSVVL
jgi:8-amino-3,8-dideoxy-alpha-D-manno-octulosonate transaminase